ncbi:mannosyltransferase family protein [Raineyella fluvialis]|uniref:Mannosyltransferase (PIG-V) n=1 Tax=Raineyella fluvialis TaxID=2662261 RepID=A0A5Q2FEV6_9ACTN|nr:mannosyltransferase family protein [Raineyella fluvialis]QGF23255.1 hypothetical protein Rai3103_05785 [Raineyella fluvialis]
MADRSLLGRDRALRTVTAAWLGSRTLLLATVALTAVINGWGFVGLLGHWDVEHFARIARQGYAPNHLEMAFFPGLPLLMRLGLAVGLPPQITGVLLSLPGSALAALALHRIASGASVASDDPGDSGSSAEHRARGTWATVAWLVAPTAVFTVVGYTEALFCAAAFWAWERARADRWALAAVLAAAATTLRVSGLFLIGTLAVLALTWPPARGLPLAERLRAAARRAVWLLLPLAVLVAYVVYLWTLTGSWTAWFAAQQAGWLRTFTLPWDAVRATLVAVRPGGYADANGWGWMFRFELVSTSVGLITVGWMLRRRRWAEAAWVGIQLLAFSFSPWLMSVNRAVLLWFPTWTIVGEVAARAVCRAPGGVPRPAGRVIAGRVLVGGAMGASVVVMAWWAWMFATGQWSS